MTPAGMAVAVLAGQMSATGTVTAGWPAPRATFAPLVAGYTVDGPLGFGSGGAVWSARDTGGHGVAIRVLAPLGEERDAARRRRLDALRALRHPNLAAVLDVVELPDGGRAVVSEVVTGPSLATVRAGRRGLSAPEALGVVRQLASALVVLHARGVVHADIAPSNIVLTSRGDAVVPVLVDLAGEGAWETGTPGFRAPELQRDEPAGTAADVYALGALCAWAALWSERHLVHETLARALAVDPAARPGAVEVERDLAAVAVEPVRLPDASTLAGASLREQAQREETRLRAARRLRRRRPRHRRGRRWGALAAAVAVLAGAAAVSVLGGVGGTGGRPPQVDQPVSRTLSGSDLRGQDVGAEVSAAVRELTARRDAALDAGDAQALARVSAPGSPMRDRDAALIAEMQADGVEVDGLLTRIDSLVVVEVDGPRAVVEAHLVQEQHHRSWVQGESLVSVPVEAQPQRCVQLTLGRGADGGWVMADASGCAGGTGG